MGRTQTVRACSSALTIERSAAMHTLFEILAVVWVLISIVAFVNFYRKKDNRSNKAQRAKIKQALFLFELAGWLGVFLLLTYGLKVYFLGEFEKDEINYGPVIIGVALLIGVSQLRVAKDPHVYLIFVNGEFIGTRNAGSYIFCWPFVTEYEWVDMQWTDFDGHDEATFVKEEKGGKDHTFAAINYGGQFRPGRSMTMMQKYISMRNRGEAGELCREKTLNAMHDVLGSSDVAALIQDIKGSTGSKKDALYRQVEAKIKPMVAPFGLEVAGVYANVDLPTVREEAKGRALGKSVAATTAPVKNDWGAAGVAAVMAAVQGLGVWNGGKKSSSSASTTTADDEDENTKTPLFTRLIRALTE